MKSLAGGADEALVTMLQC